MARCRGRLIREPVLDDEQLIRSEQLAVLEELAVLEVMVDVHILNFQIVKVVLEFMTL